MKTTSPDDVDLGYLKYLAENIIHLTLSTTDDVLSMVFIIDRISMTLGTDLLSHVQFLKKQGLIDIEQDDNDDEMSEDHVVASKIAIALYILLQVKNLLVEIYDIPDE